MRFFNLKRRQRRGSVAIEFALVAPIFFLVVFACVEFSRVSMLQCAVENAAFEGARRGIIPGGTSAICQSTTEDLVEMAGIQTATVTVTPATIDGTTQVVSVNVDLPLSAENGFGVSGFVRGWSMSKTVSLHTGNETE